MLRYIIGLLVLVSILMAGCGERKEKIEFEVVSQGFYSPLAEKYYDVIGNESKFLKFVKKTGVSIEPPDFSKETLIAVFMGEKRTGGYKIEVSKIEREGGEVVVYVDNIVPSKTCIVTQQITSPFQIVKVREKLKDVRFVENVITAECQ